MKWVKYQKFGSVLKNADQTINVNYGYMVFHLIDAGNDKFNNKFMLQFACYRD